MPSEKGDALRVEGKKYEMEALFSV